MSTPGEVKRAPESAIRDHVGSPAAHPRTASEQGANLTAFSPATSAEDRPEASLPHEQDSAAFAADCDLSDPAAFGPGPDASGRGAPRARRGARACRR